MSAPEHYKGPAVIQMVDLISDAEIEYRVEHERIFVNEILPPINGLAYWKGTASTVGGPLALEAATLTLPDGRIGRIIIVQMEPFETTSFGDRFRRYAASFRYGFVGNGHEPRLPE